jgi:two-component system LytT family response regulator
MYKAIIIEDEQKSAAMLEGMLNDIDPEMVIADKCTDLPSGIRSIKKHRPVVVFLDIELPVYSGVQLLDFFEPSEVDFRIIFTTAYNEHAVRAFEMCAVDYLLKPIQESQLRAAVAKLLNLPGLQAPDTLTTLRKNFIEETNKKIVLPVANGYEILNLQDICYLKAEGSYTQIVARNDTSLLASKNLKYFQFVLEGAGYFFRIHRSIIVNIHFAKKLLRNEGVSLILETGAQLPVANEKVVELLQLLRDI